MQGKRRWLRLRVWIADADGKRQNGTLWWEDESHSGGLQVIPKATEGVRWEFADGMDKTPSSRPVLGK
jgi:hypothetical protein